MWSWSFIWLFFGIYMHKMLDLCVHIACWPCELYLECGSHNIQWYIANMFTALLEWLVPGTAYVTYACEYIPHIVMLCIWHIWHICPIWKAYFIRHIFGNNIWSSSCSSLCCENLFNTWQYHRLNWSASVIVRTKCDDLKWNRTWI